MSDLPGITFGHDAAGLPTATIFGRTVRLYAHLVARGEPIALKNSKRVFARGKAIKV